MRNQKITIFSSFLCFVFFSCIMPLASQAQCDKWSDEITIITFQGDTIENAYVKEMEYFYHADYTFIYRTKKDGKCKWNKIASRKIKEVHYGISKYIHKEMQNGTTNFLELQYDREIKYYNGTYTYSYRKQGNDGLPGKKVTKYYDYFYLEMEDKLIYIPEKQNRFLRKINKVFKHCPELLQLIEKEEYRVYDLPKIIDFYLEWKKEKE